MTALQLSAANISALLSNLSGQAVDAGVAGKSANPDQFSALLDVVGGIADDNAKAQVVGNGKKDDGKDTVVGNVAAPVQLRDAPRPVDKEPAEKSNDVSANKNADKADNITPSTRDNQADDDNDKKLPVAQAAQPQNDNKQDAKVDKQPVSDGVSEVVDELSAKIADKVDGVSGLLAILAAFLAQLNNNNAPTENVLATAQVAVNNNAQATTGDLPATFADLKQSLAQLQQFLQAANAGNAPLTDAGTQQLSAINTQLASELAALKDLLPKPDLSSPLTQTQLPQIAEIAPLLQSDVALIKEALQNFRQKLDKGSEAASLKAGTPQFTTSTAPTLVQAVGSALSADNQLDILTKAAEEKFSSASSAVISTPVQTLTVQTNQQNSNTPPVLAANFAPLSANLENNTGGNSGQGGGSQPSPQFSIGGVSANAAPNASNKAADFSAMMSKAAHTPVAEQVTFQIKNMPKTGSSSITIQLDPEELGKLDITLDVDSKGKAGVTITADNKQTLDLLQRDARGLEKALADAGLKADSGSLSFNLRGGQQENNQGQNNSQATSTYRKSQPEEDIIPLSAVVRSYTVSVPDGLDISI